jgi:serine/threonine protein phosphatase PrpC
MSQNLWLRVAGRSDVGLVRENNEDSGFIGKNIILVADGMGGHAAGELASSTAVAVVARFDNLFSNNKETADSISNIPKQITLEIKSAISKDQNRSGMGTTLSACLMQNGNLKIVHVGDSRIYLIRKQQISLLTKDQTYVQSLIDNNEVTIEESRTHPQRSLLQQAIDGVSEVVPEIKEISLELGDRLILCSDGLSNVVRDAEILNAVKSFDNVGAVSSLIEKALEHGAPDNVTVVVADVVSEASNNSQVVIGAAAEPRNRIKLPGLEFPPDIHPFITSEFPALKTLSSFRSIRWIISSAVVAALLLLGTSNWVSKQFYVSNLGDNLAIFQGINVSLGPISFSSAVQSFNLEVVVLTQKDQETLLNGITADSLTEARFIVRRLDQRALCSKDYSYSFCRDVVSSIKPQ